MTVSPKNILASWHQIEFFQPYKLEEKNNEQVKVSLYELNDQKDAILPWLSPIAQAGLDIANAQAFTLYIGVFDLNVVNKLCDEKLSNNEIDANDLSEIEERLDLEGNSCFVRLPLDKHGVPNWENASISTLPWALACLKDGCLHALTASSFDQKAEAFKETLSRLSRHLGHPHSEHECINALIIAQLIIELEEWAGIRLVNETAFILEWKDKRSAKRPSSLEMSKEVNPTESYPTQNPYQKRLEQNDIHHVNLSDQTVVVSSDIEKETESDFADESQADEQIEADLPILNSFYFDDLEYAQNSFLKGQAGIALRQYLSIEPNKVVDLYTADGLANIKQRVSVDNMPYGRWPSNPNYNMSLMQQYAINTAIGELKKGGLLSVNGPPGTGKTTLLRDMIAHNLVERAKVLASFASVGDSHKRRFSSSSPCWF